ncbi:Uncharacterized membrane protein YckC, RDD family [Solimonas aquatica]|uniref:Uncharacterized membrane protein YckC, RDD family n=1 Tax=Solimonas aquatica TaxID=489703 RepID=A0A1H9APF9_9GAMM|nr:RDD family protein [Solimonas aquatica]SEP77798.1 Uncharacterized membrane protein YckC, RDD family [Solimonas aquatica]
MSRSETLQPAPIWRRLAASVYDGLLLLGLWMSAILVEEVLRALFGFGHAWAALRAYLLLLGFCFFGWSWTHGGQTLGMRAWRLRVDSAYGPGLRWPAALSRYALLLCCWGVSLAPLLARLPQVREEPLARPVTLVCLTLLVLGFTAMRLDRLRRGPQDHLSGSLVVLLPRTPG